jgi:hypothetical protein
MADIAGKILDAIFAEHPDTQRRIEASWYATDIKLLLVLAYLKGKEAALKEYLDDAIKEGGVLNVEIC